MRTPDYVQQRIQDNTLLSLGAAVRLSPTSGLALAGLAGQILNHSGKGEAGARKEAAWFSRRAVELAPTEPGTWLARAKLLEREGELAAALAVLDRATAVLPENSSIWLGLGLLSQKTND